ncbi:hypothetical protein GCM10007420_24830 [Glycocaulis albus]|uniref:Nudix hydrolase domain-containing protein n=1 Tax=Glycocaulis albus TaxID=1382801 RepID=A0ABQ1XYL8_9PROT|nr:hypothetical protein [Glycocaulis albus]MBV5258070.1 hypothetical protein [Synechococcus moorigangaii CMS01]GGH07173.1 hypothetical protein GCM10007420_24830 [Glycocaulis albus]
MFSAADFLLGVLSSAVATVVLAAVGRARGVLVLRRPPPRLRIGKTLAVKEELNQVFAGQFEMVGIRHLLPQMEHDGPLELASDLIEEAEDIRRHLARNQMHALLEKEASNLDSDPLHLVYRHCDYAAIRALRNHGGKPPIISAGAVVTCSESRQVVLHQRSRFNVDTMKGRLHVFGGAYMYETSGLGSDAGDLSFTAAREMFEEAGVFGEPPAKWPALISWEVPSGFLQYIYLGVDVPLHQIERQHGYPEGNVILVDFDELEELLVKGKWVDSGRAAILLWLALGAPTAGQQRFGAGKARGIYRRVLRQLVSN